MKYIKRKRHSDKIRKMTNSTTYNNYIAGEWVAGTETIENRNPSEPSDLIGLYAQADEKQLHAALAAAKAAQEKWADVGLEKRHPYWPQLARR